ncbi:MAG: hypothetical protein U9Q79_01445 [Candidatus Hydrogenedentes bacterium]|nr:hypothetical protein [Candidatus Hydrogenedentota bacterium]
MSSILDALNKAEEERTAAEEARVRGFDDLDIEGELTGRSPSNDGQQRGFAVTPLKVLGVSISLIAVIALVSGGAAIIVLQLVKESNHLPVNPRPASEEPTIATAAPSTPLPETRTMVRPALPAISPESIETEVSETGPAPDTPDITANSAPPVHEEPVSDELAAPASAPQDVTESAARQEVSQAPDWPPEADDNKVFKKQPSNPESATSEPPSTASVPSGDPALALPPVQVASAAPPKPAYPAPSETGRRKVPTYPDATPPPEPVPPEPNHSEVAAVSESVAPGEVDIMSLPELTESARRRLHLPEITVNVVGRPSKYRPQPSAMINFNRVVLNEFIPGTDAKLIGVSLHGIGIQVGQERYFVPK